MLRQDKRDTDIESLLQQLETFIVDEVRRYLPIPNYQQVDRDDLVQNVRMKLWQAFQKHHIMNPQAYVGAIVHNEARQVRRGHRHVSEPLTLYMSEDRELCERESLTRCIKLRKVLQPGNVTTCQHSYIHSYSDTNIERTNSVQEFELKEEFQPAVFLEQYLMDIITTLSKLKEKIDLQRIGSSLCLARKKMQRLRTNSS